MDFDQAIEIVMKVEGGYVNDATDPGGETKWGISKRAFPNVDIRNLTKIEARKIYFDHYWAPSKCSLMPERLRLIFFDMCVHHGIYSATVTLQKALNGSGYPVKVDGLIGDKTLSVAPYLEPERLRSYRVLRIGTIVAKRPTMEKYWYGWYKRAISV
jgi:lysozyme family protein